LPHRCSAFLVAGIAAIGLVYGPSTALAAETTVTFGGAIGNTYDPPEVAIAVGDTVTWQPNAGTGFDLHPLVSDDGAFATVSDPDAVNFSHDFDAAGDFAFHCAYHPGMAGIVHVSAPTTAPTVALAGTAAVAGAPVTLTATTTDPDPGDSITRHEWDLDHDGSRETDTGSQNTVTTTFATAGEHVVLVRVVDQNDKFGEATLTVNVQPKPIAPPVPPPATDTQAPVTSAPGAQTAPIARVLRAGVYTTTLLSDEPANVRARLLSRTGTVLAKSNDAVQAGTTTLKLKLTKAGRRTLRKTERSLKVTLKLRVTDLAGNSATVKKRIKLRK
jgi:plastocyanin